MDASSFRDRQLYGPYNQQSLYWLTVEASAGTANNRCNCQHDRHGQGTPVTDCFTQLGPLAKSVKYVGV